jgi:hypothetical protein
MLLGLLQVVVVDQVNLVKVLVEQVVVVMLVIQPLTELLTLAAVAVEMLIQLQDQVAQV